MLGLKLNHVSKRGHMCLLQDKDHLFIRRGSHYKDTDGTNPDSKVHGDNMGPTWVLLAPDGPHKPCYQGTYVYDRNNYIGKNNIVILNQSMHIPILCLQLTRNLYSEIWGQLSKACFLTFVNPISRINSALKTTSRWICLFFQGKINSVNKVINKSNEKWKIIYNSNLFIQSYLYFFLIYPVVLFQLSVCSSLSDPTLKLWPLCYIDKGYSTWSHPFMATQPLLLLKMILILIWTLTLLNSPSATKTDNLCYKLHLST